jgi:SAM-dependent methyltransferase
MTVDTAAIDGLTSATIKHLREAWWDEQFTEFLAETLRPRPGNRILDVGCGEGLAEVAIGRLRVSQLELVGVDLVPDKVRQASQEAAAHNQRARFAAGAASALPFRTGAFDSSYTVAVLQHVRDAGAAVAELARVTRPRGRVVAVEPDNSARYGFSSTPAGRRAFELSRPFFNALAGLRPDVGAPALGPNVPALFAAHGIEPMDVRLFPVSETWLGAPDAEFWRTRRQTVERLLGSDCSDAARWLGREYLDTLDEYETEAREAGSAFVEIQNTILFATVGQREA